MGDLFRSARQVHSDVLRAPPLTKYIFNVSLQQPSETVNDGELGGKWQSYTGDAKQIECEFQLCSMDWQSANGWCEEGATCGSPQRMCIHEQATGIGARRNGMKSADSSS